MPTVCDSPDGPRRHRTLRRDVGLITEYYPILKWTANTDKRTSGTVSRHRSQESFPIRNTLESSNRNTAHSDKPTCVHATDTKNAPLIWSTYTASETEVTTQNFGRTSKALLISTSWFKELTTRDNAAVLTTVSALHWQHASSVFLLSVSPTCFISIHWFI
jgi:hypothetical protein